MSQFPTLLPYGWNDQPLPSGTLPARVIRHDGASLQVITAGGTATLRNSLKLDPAPTVGDWLALDGEHVVEVLPRRSLLRRQSADEVGMQALAANVDVVLIACGIDRPVKAGRIQRSVTLAWDAGATPVLVLTKANGADAAAIDLPRLELQHPGVSVIVTSALEGLGLDAVRSAIAGLTAVLLGESGAGKSTLVNALLGRGIDAVDASPTGGVRSDAKGRHTTTSRQLHLLPGETGGGVIIDTPGIRSVGLFTDAESVDASFADIRELASLCRFGDCQHRTEPGCAVLAALETGELALDRYDGWRHLQREVASAVLRSSPRAMHEHTRQFGRMVKDTRKRKRE